MLIYVNEYKTKENQNWTKDKIELQQIHCLLQFADRPAHPLNARK